MYYTYSFVENVVTFNMYIYYNLSYLWYWLWSLLAHFGYFYLKDKTVFLKIKVLIITLLSFRFSKRFTKGNFSEVLHISFEGIVSSFFKWETYTYTYSTNLFFIWTSDNPQIYDVTTSGTWLFLAIKHLIGTFLARRLVY